MKQYYVYGTVDDCTGHWGKFMDCLKKKTVRYKDDVPADGSEGKHPIWQLRTQEEATEFWTAEFDRRAKEPGAPGVGGDGSEGHQTTMI